MIFTYKRGGTVWRGNHLGGHEISWRSNALFAS
jgi:hypothetical protein